MNGARPIFSRVFKKKLIVKKANKKEIIIAKSKSKLRDCWLILLIPKISTIEITPIVGMDSKKLYLAEKSILYPINSAVMIVTPDLEAPGISAKHCPKPIVSESKYVRSFWSLFLVFFLVEA